MSLLRFPPRRSECIWLMREGCAWLVLARSHGWLFGSRNEAMDEALSLARSLECTIREVAQ